MLGQEPCLVRKNLWNCLVNLPESWLAKKILHWERTHDYSWSKKGKKNYILVILHWTLSMCKYCLELSTNSSDVYTGKPIRQKLLVLFKKPWYRVYPCPRTTRVSLTSSWRLSTLLILNTCNRWYVSYSSKEFEWQRCGLQLQLLSVLWGYAEYGWAYPCRIHLLTEESTKKTVVSEHERHRLAMLWTQSHWQRQ